MMRKNWPWFYGCLFVVIWCAPVAGQPIRPVPPEKYQILLRYRIHAARDQHVALYDALIAHLKKLDFEFQPPLAEHPRTDREDGTKNRLTGIISSARIHNLFENPNVASALLFPVNFTKPAEANQPVRVRLELASGYSFLAQRELSDQVRVMLAPLGFREAVAYDPTGWKGRPNAKLVGAIPFAQLENLL
jgi:hypothetical protein